MLLRIGTVPLVRDPSFESPFAAAHLGGMALGRAGLSTDQARSGSNLCTDGIAHVVCVASDQVRSDQRDTGTVQYSKGE